MDSHWGIVPVTRSPGQTPGSPRYIGTVSAEIMKLLGAMRGKRKAMRCLDSMNWMMGKFTGKPFDGFL